jgi:type VI secretion system secreted protein VgrG
MELIKHDRHLIIENDQYEKVKKDKHLQVTGDHNEKITGTMSLDVGSDQQNKVGMNYALESGMGVHIKAGMTTVIEAGTALTLKVGGSSININTGGIQIIGSPMLMLNSGGAATPGAGCSPELPRMRKKRTTRIRDRTVQLPPPNAPLAPLNIGPLRH